VRDSFSIIYLNLALTASVRGPPSEEKKPMRIENISPVIKDNSKNDRLKYLDNNKFDINKISKVKNAEMNFLNLVPPIVLILTTLLYKKVK